jgi:Uri superfamily endonuclease
MTKGVYVLLISIKKSIEVNVGALGTRRFAKGWYSYVGSAQNCLEKRVQRHLRRTKPKFWHIDYLLGNESAKIAKVFYKELAKPEECKIAERLSKNGVPIAHFGCSDCRCVSHLLRMNDYSHLEASMSEMLTWAQRRSFT